MLPKPGMQPSLAQEPKATRTFDFRRMSWAMYSCSLVRMPPLKRQTSIVPSAISSMSRTLPSAPQGNMTMSNAAATSRIFSSMARIEISQPPHEAAQ